MRNSHPMVCQTGVQRHPADWKCDVRCARLQAFATLPIGRSSFARDWDGKEIPRLAGTQRVYSVASSAAVLAACKAAQKSARRSFRTRVGHAKGTCRGAVEGQPGVWEDAAQSRSSLMRSSMALAPLAFSTTVAETCNASAATPNLRGFNAVVTGASGGIGKGIAVGLGEAGAKVYVTGRRREALESTAELVTRAGGSCIPIVCDHANDQQVEAAFKQVAEETGGSLDVLVNNAFQDPSVDPKVEKLFGSKAKFYELPLKVWDDMHNVGLRSHYVASYYAVPMMMKAAKSRATRPLLCATSSFGAVSYLFATAYGVGKAGTDRLMRDLQVELGPDGIDCLSIWPGLVLTEKVQDLIKNDPRRIDRITGGQDPARVGESPLLTGRVLARLAADPVARRPPYVTGAGLTGGVCIVAEAADDLGIRDGGLPGSVAAEFYGPDREAAPSIRSLGFLGPGPLRSGLPQAAKWLAAPGGPLADRRVKLPLEFMAQGPPPAPEQT